MAVTQAGLMPYDAEKERMRAEIERLRAALKKIANHWGSTNDDAEPCREIARKALNL